MFLSVFLTVSGGWDYQRLSPKYLKVCIVWSSVKWAHFKAKKHTKLKMFEVISTVLYFFSQFSTHKNISLVKLWLTMEDELLSYKEIDWTIWSFKCKIRISEKFRYSLLKFNSLNTCKCERWKKKHRVKEAYKYIKTI